MIARGYLIVFAGLTLLAGVAAMSIFPRLDPVTGVIGLLVQLTAVLVIGRLRPPIAAATVLVVTLAVSWVDTGWQDAYRHQVIIWIPIAASMASTRVVDESRSRAELVLGLAPLAAWCVVTVGNAGPSPITVLAGIAPVLAGLCFALFRRLQQARQDRLAELERQRIAADRERLLTDLHDLITHRITRVVLRSRQLGATVDQPRLRDGLSDIERTATETLTALRDYLAAARPAAAGDAGRSAAAEPRTVAELGHDLAGIVAAERGLDRSVRLDAPSSSAEVAIDPVVYACAVRVVREGLINAAKHAAGSAVTVTVTATDRLRIAVINDRPPAGPDPGLGAAGSGTGLRGLAGRCRLLGGTLAAGPEPDGGYAVRVELPTADRPVEAGARS